MSGIAQIIFDVVMILNNRFDWFAYHFIDSQCGVIIIDIGILQFDRIALHLLHIVWLVG